MNKSIALTIIAMSAIAVNAGPMKDAIVNGLKHQWTVRDWCKAHSTRECGAYINQKMKVSGTGCRIDKPGDCEYQLEMNHQLYILTRQVVDSLPADIRNTLPSPWLYSDNPAYIIEGVTYGGFEEEEQEDLADGEACSISLLKTSILFPIAAFRQQPSH